MPWAWAWFWPESLAEARHEHGQLRIDARGDDLVPLARSDLEMPMDHAWLGLDVLDLHAIVLADGDSFVAQFHEFRDFDRHLIADHPDAESVAI